MKHAKVKDSTKLLCHGLLIIPPPFFNKKPNVTYDAEITTEEEYNCILIYNEETKV
jgi:hypothetical protein